MSGQQRIRWETPLWAHPPWAGRVADGAAQAAQAAARTKGTYLATHFHAIRSHRGTFKAIGSIRHDILIAYSHIVREQVDHVDLGADWLVRRKGPEHQVARLVRQIEKLGGEATVTISAA